MTKIYLAIETDDQISGYSALNDKGDFLCGVIKKDRQDVLPIVLFQFLFIRGNEKTTIYFSHKDSDLYEVFCEYLRSPMEFISNNNHKSSWLMFEDQFIASMIECEISDHPKIQRMIKYSKSMIDRAKMV